MSKTFRHYTLLRPLRSDSYIDDDSAVLTRIPITDNGRTVEVALIGTPLDLRMIRISVSGLQTEPPYEERKRFDDITESILALLRIFCDNEISFAEPRFRYGNFIDDDLPASLKMKVGRSEPTYNPDAGLMYAYMHSDKELRDIFRLYADALYPYSPVQYRYLSAFKIIEHEFKGTRKTWRPELDALLEQFKAEYEALNLSKMKIRSFMISLRDKCAHVRLGDGNDLGIIGIGSKDTEITIQFLPLLIRVIQKHLFDAYKSDGTAFRAVTA
jgi:hypothetical protein